MCQRCEEIEKRLNILEHNQSFIVKTLDEFRVIMREMSLAFAPITSFGRKFFAKEKAKNLKL
jgi:hypothetical protein